MMQSVFEKIIEKLDKERSIFKTVEWNVAMNKAIEIVKQEAERYDDGWISVSDHIPVPAKKSFGNKQKRTNVLVTLRNGLVKEMTFEFETNEFWEVGDDNHIEHWKEDAIDKDAEVVAWQPLPQPYQSKGEHDENTK